MQLTSQFYFIEGEVFLDFTLKILETFKFCPKMREKGKSDYQFTPLTS